YGNQQLQFVNNFTYLGLTIPNNCQGFRLHVHERCVKATSAKYAIKNPVLLSVSNALKLFDIKIKPIALYGIRHIWDSLSPSSMEKLDSVKTNFLKRVLAVPRNTKNRLVLLMCDTQPLTVDAK